MTNVCPLYHFSWGIAVHLKYHTVQNLQALLCFVMSWIKVWIKVLKMQIYLYGIFYFLAAFRQKPPPPKTDFLPIWRCHRGSIDAQRYSEHMTDWTIIVPMRPAGLQNLRCDLDWNFITFLLSFPAWNIAMISSLERKRGCSFCLGNNCLTTCGDFEWLPVWENSHCWLETDQ